MLTIIDLNFHFYRRLIRFSDTFRQLNIFLYHSNSLLLYSLVDTNFVIWLVLFQLARYNIIALYFNSRN